MIFIVSVVPIEVTLAGLNQSSASVLARSVPILVALKS